MGRTIKTVTDRHRKAAYLKAQGHTHREIAEETGFAMTTVPAILKHPELAAIVQNESLVANNVRDMTPEEIIQRATPKAIQLLEMIVTNSEALGDHMPTMKERMEAAITLAGMGGHSKQVKVAHTHATLRPDDFKEIQRRAAQSLQEAEVIDVEAQASVDND